MRTRRSLPVRESRPPEAVSSPIPAPNARSPRPAPAAPPSRRPAVSPSRRPAVAPPLSRPLDADASAAWRALRDVMDPEFPISIVDLGLVYDVRATDGGLIEVDLTFTATGCPCMDFIREDIRDRLAREPGVEDVLLREVWDPPWTPARISPEGRAVLRRHGVGA